MSLHEMMDFVIVEKGKIMAEYITCRRCDSPDCKGCNLKRLETMLGNGKFDCLMNENRAIDTSADVESVRNGSIIETIEDGHMKRVFSCCGTDFTKMTCWMTPKYCPNCGARMDEGK